MIERLPFASTYVYSPRGQGAASISSRILRDRVKAGDADWIQRYAERVQELAIEHALYGGFFGREVTLVPVPGSAPLVGGGLWVPERIALALANHGLGGAVWAGIQRTAAVPKSAFAPPGERPTVERHLETIEVEASLAPPTRIVLVDDVVTKGRTLLAAATRIKEIYPDTDVRAFALLRTMGLVADVGAVLDPCVGEIRWQEDDAQRDP